MTLPPTHKLIGATLLLLAGFGVLALDVIYQHSPALEWIALGLFAGGGTLLGVQVFRNHEPPRPKT